jgi:hypothetical protein
MGNFNVTNVTPELSLVTVAETLPSQGWIGNTIQANIRWSMPNRLVV